jgi:hypothetical protein
MYYKCEAYLWGSNVLSSITDATSLHAADLIDAFVPGSLDKTLKM